MPALAALREQLEDFAPLDTRADDFEVSLDVVEVEDDVGMVEYWIGVQAWQGKLSYKTKLEGPIAERDTAIQRLEGYWLPLMDAVVAAVAGPMSRQMMN